MSGFYQYTSLPDIPSYFLNKRDWRPLNEGVWENFPFGRLRHSEGEEGDVGLEAGHDSFEQYPLDCCASVLIVSRVSEFVLGTLLIVLLPTDQY